MSNLSSLYKSIEKIMWTDTGLNGDAQRIEQFAWMLFFKIFSDKDKELEVLDDAYQSPIPEAYRWDTWAANDEGMTGDELLSFIDRDLFPALRNLDISSGNRRALIVREVFEGNNNYMKSGGNLRKVLNKLNEIDFNRAKDRHAFGDIYEGILKGLQSAGKSGEFYTPRAVTQFICDTLAPQLGETILDPACGTGGFLTSSVEHLKAQAKNVADQKLLERVKGWEYKPLPFLLATTNLILHDVEVPNIAFRDVLDQPLSAYSQKDRVDVVLANPPFGGVVANGNETNFPATFRTKESADLFLVLIMHLLKDGGRAGVVLPDGSLTGEGVKQRVRQKLLEDCNLHTIVRLPNSVFQPYATVATNLLFFTKGTPTKEVWYYQHRLPEGQKSYSKTKTIRREEFQPLEDWWNNRVESEVAWCVPIQTIIDRNYDLDIKNPHLAEETHEYTSAELIELLAHSFTKSEGLLNALKGELV
ncbi:class I SAM-dependent DNA methyltransferase [Hymenobacter sp. 5414T-23]|uniref:class I SAM-dependent DNA methyltransferase n=1 Tax=Hymenobacter sp. 5414T-23 TaxID=2932252 RepID=UPI001FD37F55|nr:class I SAM-dependent DNA methyltransferase [Hymenobacter sp. 5414T-23]UOQ80994.1 type I restriction-modification system subunit M [Hymenobacter sp. 5414T-23]